VTPRIGVLIQYGKHLPASQGDEVLVVSPSLGGGSAEEAPLLAVDVFDVGITPRGVNHAEVHS